MRRKIRNSDVEPIGVASMRRRVVAFLGSKKRKKENQPEDRSAASRSQGVGLRAENGRRGPKTFDNTCKLLSKIE